jgi:hypothetical protein
MRLLLFSITAFILASCATTNLPPAGPSKTMMKQANRIILKTDNDPKENYRKLGQYLINNDFGLQQEGSQVLTIKTRYSTRSSGLSSYKFRITALVQDSTIEFYAHTESSMFPGKDYKVSYIGEGNSPEERAWKKFVEIAKGFPHDEIYYERG